MRQTIESSSFALVAVAFVLGCSGAVGPPAISPVPAEQTSATLVGPLCQLDSCQCPEDGESPNQTAAAGLKRYEVRVGPADNRLWVSIGDMTLYKSRERALECFYVDLPAGRHSVSLRATGQQGFAANVEISELAPEGLGLYETFQFDCGSPGLCDRDGLNAFRARTRSYADNTHDPCGSTKIREIQWQTGRMPDSGVPEDLELQFVLDVYKFVPTFAPTSQDCVNMRQRRGE